MDTPKLGSFEVATQFLQEQAIEVGNQPMFFALVNLLHLHLQAEIEESASRDSTSTRSLIRAQHLRILELGKPLGISDNLLLAHPFISAAIKHEIIIYQ